jgi:hypothetical protein
MELLKQIQPDIMLALSAICGVLALLVFMTNTKSKKHAGLVDGANLQFRRIFPDARRA